MHLASLTDHCLAGRELTPEECATAAYALVEPAVPDEDKASFLRALTDKGETPGELAAWVQALLPLSVDPGLSGDLDGSPLFDCCGTGGGSLDLVNVSTSLMFLLAAAGVPVTKHGNRGVTKKAGSADLLQHWRGTLDDSPAAVLPSLRQHGLAFCFAPVFHPAFRHVAAVRKQLAAEGRRTVFNLLGPLLNPCRPQTQMVGVFRREHLPLFAEALRKLGRRRYLVVYGEDAEGRALGEVSSIGPTRLLGSLDGVEVDREIHPVTPAPVTPLLVCGAAESAARIEAVFHGRETGLLAEFILLNAAVGAWVNGITDSIGAGEKQMRELLHSGLVTKKLESWVQSDSA
ncbi:MAG: anthranilate phosphoribosyltransferase [Candidatus Methylacidiphilales bacterium]